MLTGYRSPNMEKSNFVALWILFFSLEHFQTVNQLPVGESLDFSS